ncbi:MAG: hypothetical protein ACP5K5_02020 [Candidatus Micrarchaeia archaeon]
MHRKSEAQLSVFIGSILLLLYTLYYLEKLSYSNGFYSALLLIAHLNSTIVAQEGITNLASQSAATAFGLYIVYILVSLGLVASALGTISLLSTPRGRLLWIALTFDSLLFSMIGVILIHTFNIGFMNALSIMLYVGVLLVLVPSAMMLSIKGEAKRIPAKTIEINPETPFTNMLMLSNRFMSKLSGNIKILDMHFDASALENLSRLIRGHEGQYKSIMVLSKGERLGKDFSMVYRDFIAELERKSIAFELRILPLDLTTDLHERLIIDDSFAYKIPPLNIINKKSEHIVAIKREEAVKRFEYLWARSTKFENLARP